MQAGWAGSREGDSSNTGSSSCRTEPCRTEKNSAARNLSKHGQGSRVGSAAQFFIAISTAVRIRVLFFLWRRLFMDALSVGALHAAEQVAQAHGITVSQTEV